jgi:hypothetical protein
MTAQLSKTKKGNQMPNELKVKPFPGVQYVASKSIATNATEQSLRAAQYELDLALHDLRSEFIAREGKLKDQYLATVAEISGQAE